MLLEDQPEDALLAESIENEKPQAARPDHDFTQSYESIQNNVTNDLHLNLNSSVNQSTEDGIYGSEEEKEDSDGIEKLDK